MRGTFDLAHPIMINGKSVCKLKYDSEEITAEQFLEADGRAQWKASTTGTPKVSSMIETDASLHLYLAFMGIIAVNPDIDITDLERIKGIDVINLSKIGRNFGKGNMEEDSESEGSIAETLEALSEATVEPITPESATSEE